MNLESIYRTSKEQRLEHRYITNKHIEPILNDLESIFEIDVLGRSVMDKSIYSIKVGSGKTKILMWSQMHGNESTTTKALFDMLNWLKSDAADTRQVKNNFTFYILPILNPDGAALYTRENANKVDLNRDAVNLSQPESKLLRQAFDEFQPDFCYNMHDQRTIFGLETVNGVKPATLSFLAPAYNDDRTINSCRQTAINLIVAMNKSLQRYIPNQVGRFDDSFNINCVGDSFQALGVPTILFEAGHYKDDYERERTREFVFFALLSGFNAINENVLVVNKNDEYFNIPQNKAIFYDIVYRNVNINYENKEKRAIFASQYKEVLFEDFVVFDAFIKEINNSELIQGHIEYDCEGQFFVGKNGLKFPKTDTEATFVIEPNRKFVNGVEV
ncbi:MAG: peptidase M14 [Flavobacterium sp. MedPE-SWcel]|uniref:M14 family metallopeptidase n=1 Tax=uncultured Flavobacterium sp. TaxID=165435 RepID=UPI00091E1557|nr:M14 metallopeptidase family protein [uncultured Flavobacterium sp.]OIQ16955.1 MAG: peptidase M14 [Flavobacterium sp. MedPE-SWcel]